MISILIRPAVAVLACSFFSASAFAQQDPDDPGLPDSIICEDVYVPYGQGSFAMPIYFRVDDSVAVFIIPLRCGEQAGGGITPSGGVEYQAPFIYWDDIRDTFYVDQGYLLILGWADLNFDPYPWYPYYSRIHAMSVIFLIEPGTPPQITYADTAHDARNGSILLGLDDGVSEITPAFRRGTIYYGYTKAEDPATHLPSKISLNQNFPNPFNAETKIDFALPSAQLVRLEIFDIMGRKIRTIFDDHLDAGYHSIHWNGTDNNGDQISSGIYFYRLSAGDFSESRKMILMK